MPGKNYRLTATCATCRFCCTFTEHDCGTRYFCRYGQKRFGPPKFDYSKTITLARSSAHSKAQLKWEAKTEVEGHGLCDLFEYVIPGEKRPDQVSFAGSSRFNSKSRMAVIRPPAKEQCHEDE